MTDNNAFVNYLNTLHNYYAQNKNSYGENNIESPFFEKVMVKMGLSNFIINQLTREDPHIIILTGHAGDGKTSLMYQITKQLSDKAILSSGITKITLSNGNECYCIKDFSEMSDDDKKSDLQKLLSYPEQGKYVFMVANTGPLINTFGELYDDSEKKDKAEIELVEALDSNDGTARTIGGFSNICLINVAKIDNTSFAVSFLSNLIKDELWSNCTTCSKAPFCSIFRNRNLIVANRTRVFDFIKKHYIWLADHGKRLTIRSMTEQLAFMLTGGLDCNDMQPINSVTMVSRLFPNLFFGYSGVRYDAKTANINAINYAYDQHYDLKRLRADEILIVENNLHGIFSNEVENLLNEAKVTLIYSSGWKALLHRFYIFLNILQDETELDEDIFSKIFPRYLNLRDGTGKPNSNDIDLIKNALSMIYVGTMKQGLDIPLTLSRESGMAQNVQIITGTIPNRLISVDLVRTCKNVFGDEPQKYDIYLTIDRKRIDSVLSLPLLNYFYDLKNGIISTNVDPQLSHGVESLKAQLSETFCDKTNEINSNSIELIVLNNSSNGSLKFDINGDNTISVTNYSTY